MARGVVLELARWAPSPMAKIVWRYSEYVAAPASNPQLLFGRDIRVRYQATATRLDDAAYRIEKNALLGPRVPSSVLAGMLDKACRAIRTANVARCNVATAAGLAGEKAIDAKAHGFGTGLGNRAKSDRMK